MRNHAADAADNVGGVSFSWNKLPTGDAALPAVLLELLGMQAPEDCRLCAACAKKVKIWMQLTPRV
jgi:hypothetical protein